MRMNKNRRKIFLSFLLVVFLVSIFSVYGNNAQADNALIQCGRLQDDPATPANEKALCTVCDTLKLVKRIVDFVMFELGPAVAVLLFLWAGFLILISGSSPSQLAKGKEIFWNVVKGLFFMFGAWMIANTTIQTLAEDSNVSNSWFKLECKETIITAVTPTPAPPGEKDIQAIARRLLANSDIVFATNADCGGSFHAKKNIEDIAAGKFPAVCSSTCSSTNLCKAGGVSGTITVNLRILEGVEGLAKKMEAQSNVGITVTSFTTGKHSATSEHYTGEAVDIVVNNRNSSDWKVARSYLNNFGGTAICEKPDGSNEPDCNLNIIDHIHWSLPR